MIFKASYMKRHPKFQYFFNGASDFDISLPCLVKVHTSIRLEILQLKTRTSSRFNLTSGREVILPV